MGTNNSFGGMLMQPESKPSDELLERYEKNFGAAGRRRGFIILTIATIFILGAIIGITRSMSYVGGLNSQIHDAFDLSDKRQEQAPPTE
jgi:hypothetical protein